MNDYKTLEAALRRYEHISNTVNKKQEQKNRCFSSMKNDRTLTEIIECFYNCLYSDIKPILELLTKSNFLPYSFKNVLEGSCICFSLNIDNEGEWTCSFNKTNIPTRECELIFYSKYKQNNEKYIDIIDRCSKSSTYSYINLDFIEDVIDIWDELKKSLLIKLTTEIDEKTNDLMKKSDSYSDIINEYQRMDILFKIEDKLNTFSKEVDNNNIEAAFDLYDDIMSDVSVVMKNFHPDIFKNTLKILEKDKEMLEENLHSVENIL